MNVLRPNRERILADLVESRQVLAETGSALAGLAVQMADLRDRLIQDRFVLAVLGQFKRGKSSLLNALLGEPLLPTGVLPLTAIPTRLCYGTERLVRVVRQDGRREITTGSVERLAQVLTQTVTERENPTNRLRIEQVTVEHPNSLLIRGMEILDTPGIGSTILHNTKSTRALLPVSDGALVVLSPDPPITEVELHFLRAVKDAVARVIFVVTKADMLTPSDRQEVLAFLRQVLHDRAGFPYQTRVFLVSAQQGLQARLTGNPDLWAQSGLGELETYLANFLVTDKQAALCEAIQAKAVRVIDEALFVVELHQKVIDLPREELDRRLERFERHLVEIDQERLYFHDRLAGDRQRMLQELDRLANELEEPARKALDACVERVREQAGTSTPLAQLESQIRIALSSETEEMFGHYANELSAAVTGRFRSIEETHCREIERLIERIRRTAADLFEVPYLEGVALDRLEAMREPRVVTQRWVTSFTEEALSWVMHALPSRLRFTRIERQLREHITYLIRRNVEELRWPLRQNLEETFRTFETRMDAQIEATTGYIRQTIRQVVDRQTERESLANPELRRLLDAREHLERLRTTLSRCGAEPSYGRSV